MFNYFIKDIFNIHKNRILIHHRYHTMKNIWCLEERIVICKFTIFPINNLLNQFKLAIMECIYVDLLKIQSI